MFWTRMTEAPVAEISAEEVRSRLEAKRPLVILDVREPGEFANGHIPGARLIPLGQIQARLGELDPNRELIVVCRSGRRSAQAALSLARQGFSRVLNMTGGMLAWRGPVRQGLG